jgi:hypothetical protein
MKTDPMSHVAARLTHALRMLSQLIPYTTETSLDRIVQIACLEDWFTNYRLIIEFVLGLAPANCANTSSFVPSWKPSSEAKGRLGPEYGWASEDVSHIGMPTKAARGDIDPSTLRTKAQFLVAVVRDFADAMTNQGSVYAPTVQLAVKQADQALAAQLS